MRELPRMKKNLGRTGRKRKKKDKQTHVGTGVNLSYRLEYVQLRRWLKLRGFTSCHLLPASFPDTGRGLMTTKELQAGDLIISLPESCLLTTSTVLKSYMGDYIKRWKPPVSPLLALCVFLIAELHFGTQSDWKPYIDSLPKTFDCAAYLPANITDLLPEPLRGKAKDQRVVVEELYLSSRKFFHSLQPLFTEKIDDIFTLDALRWAWSSVNTRTVYMKNTQSKFLSRDVDVYALAPYLDLLNHSSTTQVTAAFNLNTRCYEIKAESRWQRYEQVFICYGPHDSQRLLLEYGFVLKRNPHSVVYVTEDVLQSCMTNKDNLVTQKFCYLKENNFLENLTFGCDGPSWRLMTALKLLCLGPDDYSTWKQVLLGGPVSVENERMSFRLAQSVCNYLLHANNKSLQKIDLMRLHNRGDLKEQLDLIQHLREEELHLLKYSAEMLTTQ
ncbi:SET domain-containing protein 4 isoform X1 [Erpetoichthys calabaricus]|uniref:SET domain-containing protein 4 isoform X1 n=2 Tax=Erpetoichthys calabaricus TaxID=27687 RepID=UPI0022344841|nr:SET domain-containing protein 4 isoform X1 [Erpetoichthys calabaricus]